MAAWTVPPFPHPLPERRIGIISTEQGLLVYPRNSTHLHQHRHHHHGHTSHHVKASTSAVPSTPASRPFGSGDGFKVATIGAYNASSLAASTASLTATGALPPITSLDVGFLIDWSKDAKITPLQPAACKAILDGASSDDASIECSGIIGLSRFFSSSYLFVITSSNLIGDYFHHTRQIYCCTGVLPIPLLREEASQAIHAQAAKQGSAASQTPAAAQPSDLSTDEDAAGESSSASDSDSSESDYDDVETPSANPKPQYKVHQQQEPDASLAREQHDLSTTRSHDSVADTSAAIDPVSTAEEATVVTQQPQLLVAMGLSSDELQHVTQKVWEVFGDTL